METQEPTVNVTNEVGKHRYQQITRCISSELYLFSSMYLCKQKLQSKSKSEKETKRVQLIQTTRGLGR